ncbi:MAG: hypothetical protein RIE73_28750 [Coleofasciculus sp. C1-SOL-03]|jgi:hypothetical protein|uniref:hypothetical protein n=1 Tax=Coleofasciculus sp. C1-SOL-03 TaxID=3069522 RepID=UPI0033011AD7
MGAVERRLKATGNSSCGVAKLLEQLRRYDEAGGAEGAEGAGEDVSCSVISAFLH